MKNHNATKRGGRWLCIAYAYPPFNRSGTHRTAAFVRGLCAYGWRATVLTVEPPPGEPVDIQLQKVIPAEVRVERAPWWRPVEAFRRSIRQLIPLPRARGLSKTHSRPVPCVSPTWKRAIASLLTTPDSRVGWILPAVCKGLRSIVRNRPDVMYSTSPYPSAHLIALLLNRLTRIPWVADFRDPWCGNPFQLRRTPLAERLDLWLEARVFRHAARIICNTPTMREDFVLRHPCAAPKTLTILNGIDTETMNYIEPLCLVPEGHFAFVHCGQFYGPRSPVPLFDAFRRFQVDCPERSSRVQLVFIGPAAYQGRPLADLAREAGVEHQVQILGELAHAEALACCAAANALVLVGADGPGSRLQVPQKLFEYLYFRRPILAMLSEGNPGCAILRDASFDGVIVKPSDAASIASAIRTLSDPARLAPKDAWCGVPRFDRAERVRELSQVFASVCKRPVYTAISSDAVPRSRLYANTMTASIRSIAASAKSTVATQATLLPDAP